ncbi:hypothetical protein CYMTET_7457 [Cymbomonas tetramitiformis]|uniref:Uncharacterized protein n=1 Tax=Cymbomonas tetramitiformis TaxID=36881 RepID=A0AAE0GVG0_9CHLO|nr:hypothetical protein CYMTET_7457 [Cymbomonas tetramitiformis]|eukprot:gene201-350_t
MTMPTFANSLMNQALSSSLYDDDDDMIVNNTRSNRKLEKEKKKHKRTDDLVVAKTKEDGNLVADTEDQGKNKSKPQSRRKKSMKRPPLGASNHLAADKLLHDDAAAKDVPIEDVEQEDVPLGGVEVENAQADAQMEQAQVEQAQVEQAQVEQAQVEQTQVEQMQVDVAQPDADRHDVAVVTPCNNDCFDMNEDVAKRIEQLSDMTNVESVRELYNTKQSSMMLKEKASKLIIFECNATLSKVVNNDELLQLMQQFALRNEDKQAFLGRSYPMQFVLSSNGEEADSSMWSRYPPNAVMQRVLDGNKSAYHEYYLEHIQKIHAASAQEFVNARVGEDLSLPNPEQDVARYQTTLSEWLKLLRINSADLADICMTFHNSDDELCLFTPSQVVTIYMATTLGQSNVVTVDISMERLFAFMRTYKENQEAVKSALAQDSIADTSDVQNLLTQDYDKLYKHYEKNALNSKYLYVKSGANNTSGRIVKFINLPAGGGKTPVSLEICYVLLGLRSMNQMLQGLPSWSSVITSTDANSFSIINGTQYNGYARSMLRLCIIAVDRNTLSTWKTVHEYKNRYRGRVSNIDAYVVSRAGDLGSLPLELEKCAVDKDSTEDMLRNSRGLVLLCEMQHLLQVLQVVDGRAFAALVVDDPKASHMGVINPICRYFFMLSANCTEFLTSLKTASKTSKEHSADKTQSMYKRLINPMAKNVEEYPLEIKNNLLLPEGATFKLDMLRNVESTIEGNVYRSTATIVAPYMQQWIVKEMSHHMPSKVIVFPLCTKDEHGLGRALFSDEKLYTNFPTLPITTPGRDGKRSPVVLKQKQLISCTKKSVDLSALVTAGFLHIKEKASSRTAKAQKTDKADQPKDPSVIMLGERAQWYSAPLAVLHPVPTESREKQSKARASTSKASEIEPRFCKWLDDTNTLINYDKLKHDCKSIEKAECLSNISNHAYALPFFPYSVLDTSIPPAFEAVEKENLYVCMRCSQSFDVRSPFVQTSLSHLSFILCPTCGFHHSRECVDKGAALEGEHKLQEQSKLRDSETLEETLSRFRERCNDEENFPVLQYLVEMLGDLVLNQKSMLRRFLLYVSDQNRDLMRCCMKLLQEEYGTSFKEYAEQPIICSSLTRLMHQDDESAQTSDAPKRGRSAQRRQRNLFDAETDKRMAVLNWFNEKPQHDGASTDARFLILSSDMKDNNQELYGLDARQADCTIFADTPKSHRIQAVARGLRMSNNAKEAHLIIQL